ncbi:MAG: gliding motility-associated C-terminal domain-containing protein [Bacteroidia bacterium]|nr:gliding motility-associated C-terminal domain-containing protein [Bacteroidia bacterium]
MLKKLLLFIALFVSGIFYAQSLYWVGGSGYWNDKNHWSFQSGGVSANIIPGATSNVIFDNQSGGQDFVVHILQNTSVNTISAQNQFVKAEIISSPNVELRVFGALDLNHKFSLGINGILNLTPDNDCVYRISPFPLNCDVRVNTNKNIKFEYLNTLKSIYLSGNLKLNNSILISTNVYFENASIQLDNSFFQTSNVINFNTSNLSSSLQNQSRFICKKSNLSQESIRILTSAPGVNLAKMADCVAVVGTPTNVSCNATCDGVVVFDMTGCATPTGPYDIQWLNTNAACQSLPAAEIGYSGTTYSINTVCDCVTPYIVIFTNNTTGEQSFPQALVGKQPRPLLNITSVNPNCFSNCDGQIRTQILSGSPPISVSYNPPNISHTGIGLGGRDTLKNACSGTYTIVATGSDGCLNTFTRTLTQPQVLLTNGSSSSITCNGVCNGSATVSPTGGTSPYTYTWVPATSNTTTIANLCPGVVTMTMTDTKSCTATYSANIVQPPAVTLTVTKTDLNCRNICNGTASVTATGGIGGFTYSWSPSGGTTSQATGLCAGNYTCTVTNNVNCVQTITVDILSPPTLTATPTQTNVLCNAVCSASVNLNPAGGSPGYTYTWTAAVSTGSLANNLCAGVYSYTIGDVLGCQYTNSVTITEPPATTLTIANTSITCNGACNGTATGNMSGGAGSYTYSWSPGNPTGQATATVTGLCPGTYTLRVTDGNGCSISRTTVITQPTQIAVNVTSVSPTCNGVCDGSINSNPSGGSAPYSFTLQPTSGAPITSNPPFTNLCAGIFTLTVRDNNGCARTQTINLTQPNPILLTLNATSINCFNQCNATISSVVNGGSPVYTFTWSSGGTGNSISNQCAGVQTATVTDANGCRASSSVTITSRPDLTVSITPTNPNCNAQCTGIATTSVSGGTPNYTINWNNGGAGNIINNLCQGVYTATVTDFFGCIKTQTVAIVTPPAITLTTTNGTVSCAGSCNGIVSVTSTGGTAGYFYSWNSTPAQATQSANGLCAGNYVVSVTDAQGCIASSVANVSQPAALTSSVSNVLPSCNVCIGSATAHGIGGTAPYTYSWSPGGQTTQTANNLCVGIQTVTVTDSRGCTSTQTLQINQTVIILATTNGSTLTCNGACNGVATANPSGGIGPYTYSWSPAPVQTTQTATGLCAGIHTVMVSDANGCTNTSTVNFVNPPAITLNVNQTNVTCNSLCDGVATATASGGTGVISYVWQPGGSTSPSISGLCAGNYTVTATDINNCSQTQVVTITQNSSLAASFTFTNPTTCTSSDGSISAVISGGTPAYTFTWMPGNFTTNPLINLAAGTYSLYVNDAAGCTQTIVTTLSNPTGPTVTVTSNSVSCFGSCTGSATLSITGSAPFSVNGSAIPSNTTAISGLCAGNFISVITDANTCVTNQLINIAQPTPFTATGVVVNETCNAACNGAINLSPSGGTPGYSYTWSPSGGFVQDPTSLCANNYSVNISDANGCSITQTFVVTQPSTVTLSFNKKDVLCSGDCTGGVRAIVSGGTSPYSYSWIPSGSFAGSNIDTLVNLCSGIYTVNVTDASGCVISGTVDIGQPLALTSTITAINIKCHGQCNGSAVINASGGTLPYTYNYNTTPVTPTQTINGLCVGTYTGIVSDANGCTNSVNFSITEPLPIVVTTTISNPRCNAVCNGSVATTVTGGNPNYNYNWIPSGGPVPNPTGLCAGNYTLVVTDDSLCTGQALVVLTDPAALIANTSFTNPTCNAGCDGIVSANPIGGTAPFSYSWSTPVFTTQTVSNLCAGIYTITLSDANSCQSIQTVTLTNPPAIAINPALIPATCGFSNGSINAVAASGVAPYTYNWLDPILAGQSTNTMVTGIPAGTYTLVVTDADGCSTSSVIALSNSNGPGGAAFTTTNVACNGQCNGAAEISNPFGGTAPYIMSWINPASASASVTALCAGVYTARLEDANNCLFFQSVTITEPQSIDDNEIIVSAACLGNCNGSIAVTPSGGNGGYTYAWSNSSVASSVSGICPGPISLTITDILNCTYTTTYTIPSITTITSSTFATNVNCFGNCNGSVLATNVAGGLPPYSFNWSDPAGQATALASGLCSGNYSVTITDANGCSNVLPAAITSPSQLTVTPTVTQPNCGLCNGSAIVNPSGGTPGYSYEWSNAQTGNTASNLCAGIYMLEVTDGNGCILNSNVTIDNTSSITGETISSANVTCSGVCDGSVTVTAIGGTAPITYHWIHNNSSSQTLNGLCAGTYFCNMTDANGCIKTASVVIDAVTNFTITPQVTQSNCSSGTGSITVNVTGGTGAYTYAWLPAGNTATLTNLAPGNYTLTVSDGNCSQTQVYAMSSVNGPVVTSTQQNITCSGLCNGSISLTLSGGTPGYTTAWSNGASTSNNTGLCAGGYSVMVTDAAGCSTVRNFSLTTVTPIVFSSADVNNPLCNNICDGSITTLPSGGVLPYSYNWVGSGSTLSVATGLCSGNYSVTVSDANGCSSQETYTLTAPSSISVTAVLIDARCNASIDGAIDLTVAGGTPGYTYSWTPGAIVTQDLNNIPAGTYSVVITDNNGCNIDSSFVIAEPAVIAANEIIVSAACFGNCNGSIALNPTGGNGGYTYSWTPSASTGTITNVCPGPQTATITDSKGCVLVVNYNVPSLTTITTTTLATNNNCFNDCNGILTATNVAGGLAPYTLQWNDPLGQSGNTAVGLCTGNYLVTITDANGCFDQIPANISAPSQITFTPNITAPSCDLCNGSAIVNPVGGTPTYTYLWSNNQTGNTATNLCSGIYEVQITDGNGCLSTSSVVINSSSGITGENVIATDVTCAGLCNGTANVTAVGGVAPITYNWVHNNSTSQTISGLCAGTYFCNMTDANGCSRTASVVIGAATSLTITSQVTQSSCSSSTGSITVSVTGGSGVYTYAWLPTGNTASVTNLAPGSYTLTVSDGSCSETEVYSINAINAPVITSTKTNISCNGNCDGILSIAISGGAPGYTTLWSNGASTSSISALCIGAYSVEVTDAAGCKAVRNFSLGPVSQISFSSPDVDDPTCYNSCNGSLTVISIGGAMPYTYSWTPVGINTPTVSGLCAGNYSVLVTDANGCPASSSFTLINPPTLTLTAVVTDASCNTALDGSIDITTSGGGLPHTYNWTPGGVITEDLINVLSGSYTVTVTDNFGCTIDSAFIINSTLTVNAIAGNDTLFCQNGTLFLNGTNSNGGITYQWIELPSGAVVSNSISTIVTPATGTNTFVLIATNGVCIDRDSLIVTSLPLPTVDAGPMVSMPVYSSSGIGGSPTGPVGSTYVWTPAFGLDNPTGPNPTSGTTVTTIYTVTVVDVNGCSNSDTVTVYIYPEVVIPNGFSPNSDGKNDVWQIDFIDQFPDCEVEVYNRWGEQLFYSKGYSVPFNGKYKGKDLPVGTYYYIINLNHPAYPKAFTSPLTIFR